MRLLTIGGIIWHGVTTGLKNAASLLAAVLLWALTCWIPYLNVGTTIGLLGLVAAMSKGEVISPLEIFRSTYRKQMGEFFLVTAFMGVGTAIGSLFLLVPGLVIGLAWSLAPLLVIDQGANPTEALRLSNELTSGRKWTIFFGTLVTGLATTASVMMLVALGARVHLVVGALFAFAGLVMSLSIQMGTQAHIYGALTGPSSRESPYARNGLTVGVALAAAVVGFAVVGVVGSPRPRAELVPAAMTELRPVPANAAAPAAPLYRPLAAPEAPLPAGKVSLAPTTPRVRKAKKP
jgi:hypothetical protein